MQHHPSSFLILFAVVQLVSGQHDHGSSSRGSDDPTAMVASIGQHQSEAGTNVAYSSSATSSDWQVNLDNKQAINLGWTLNFAQNEALFTLTINTTKTKFRHGSDIFALGFSDYGKFESADFCLLWFDLSHTVQMRDALTDPMGRLNVLNKADSYCKLAETSGVNSRDDGLLEFRFTRPLDTCQRDYYAIDNGTTHLVWFKMDGPIVVDLDRINLSDLQKQQQQHKQTERLPFESGLTRVQLAATKVMGATKRAHHHHSSATAAAIQSLDVRMENYSIPARETTYWCKLFKLPHRFEQRKFHITKYEAVIEAGNEHIVHHMELFNCVHQNAKQARELGALYEQRGGWSGECGARDRPPATEICRRVIMAWAMGARPLEYPEQVGQSIGGHHYSPYVVLEVHYNNVERKSALRDNSGLRFHYTHRLRPFDAGIMEVGLEYTDKNSIPPGLVAPLAGYCVSECTRAAMTSGVDQIEHDGSRKRPRHYHQEDRNDNDDYDYGAEEDRFNYSEKQDGERSASRREKRRAVKKQEQRQQPGIYIFAGQMHTHLAGVASWTEQVREGRLLRELQRDDHYSPHFQEIRLLAEPVHLAPGDALIHYCLYDTRQRTNITLGGYATSDEMCVTYLHYYPKIDLEVCKSSVDSRALNEYFGYLAREEGQFSSETASSQETSNLSTVTERRSTAAASLQLKSVSEKYQSIEWSPRRASELLELYASSPLSVQCNRSSGNRLPGFWNGVTPTKVYWTNEEEEQEEQDDSDDQYQLGRGAGPTAATGRQPLAGGYSGHRRGRPARSQLRIRELELERASKCRLASRQRQAPPL